MAYIQSVENYKCQLCFMSMREETCLYYNDDRPISLIFGIYKDYDLSNGH